MHGSMLWNLVANMCHFTEFKWALRSGSYKAELDFFLENWKKDQNWAYIGQPTLHNTPGSESHTQHPRLSSVLSSLT